MHLYLQLNQPKVPRQTDNYLPHFLFVDSGCPCMLPNDDEQAPRLAPEKRDFTATYALGATMRQITNY